MDASTIFVKEKLLNAIENALAHDEISIAQYAMAIKQVRDMNKHTAIINCDNGAYLFILDNVT